MAASHVMGRWAYGREIACGSGGCRNLAEWLIMGTKNGRQLTRNQPVCNLHRDSAVTLFEQRNRGLFLGSGPDVVPFQDPWAAPRRKRRQQVTG